MTDDSDQRPIVFYDDKCGFCNTQARHLERLSKQRVRLQSLHHKDAFTSYPNLTIASCMQEIKMVDSDGKIHGGTDAIHAALRLGHPRWQVLLDAYRFPPIRWLLTRLYKLIAKNRYRLSPHASDR